MDKKSGFKLKIKMHFPTSMQHCQIYDYIQFSLPKSHSHKNLFIIFFISHSRISSVLNETKDTPAKSLLISHSYCICQFPVNLSIE